MIDIDLNRYEVIFAPSTIAEEVSQNIRMILGTMFFEVPYHRDFGLNATYLDAPIQRSQALSRADIIRKINQYEPRARVEDIEFQGDALDGKTLPIVRISLND